MKTKTVALPLLNGLQPTLESTALKLMEEAGELGAAISRFRGLNGMKAKGSSEDMANDLAGELLDVAQTAITMMFVLQEQYSLDIDSVLTEHIEKLIRKGYLAL